MQYLGGKSKISKWLCAAINPIRGGRAVWDAFCGGLSMSAELSKAGPVITSDANPALIALYQAVAAGWNPPERVTEDEYRAAGKGGCNLADSDPMKAFLGFGCSFGGKWFGGFARSKDPSDARSTGARTYASQARNALQRDVPMVIASGGVIVPCNFLEMDPEDPEVSDGADEMVLYLDPPYANTESYGATGKFDHDKFWHRVRQWSALTDVFVSEYAAPFGRPILQFSHDLSVSGGVTKDARVERLYHFAPDRPGELARRAA